MASIFCVEDGYQGALDRRGTGTGQIFNSGFSDIPAGPNGEQGNVDGSGNQACFIVQYDDRHYCGSSAGYCQVPTPNDPIQTCETTTGLASQRYQRDNDITNFTLYAADVTIDAFGAATAQLTNYQTSDCNSYGIKNPNASPPEDLYCRVTTTYVQTFVEGDGAIQETSAIALISEEEACNPSGITLDGQTDTTISVNNTADVVETETVDENGATTEVKQETYTNAEYDPVTDETKTCSNVVTTTPTGVSAVETCKYEDDDQTKEKQQGGQEVTCSDPTDPTTCQSTVIGTGEPGTGVNDGIGTGTGGEGTGTGDITIDLGNVCQDPNGCEDFAEMADILTDNLLGDYDSTENDAKLQDISDRVDDLYTLETNEIETLQSNPYLIMAGNTVETLFSGLASVMPSGGACSTYIIPFGIYAIEIQCEITEAIRNILTLLLHGLLLLKLKDIPAQMAAARGS
jgi:hypothetical protein